jgi:hypothetical protein
MKKIILQIKTLLLTAASLFSLAATAQSDKGILLLNEFSNGANGNKEWAELIVANNTTGSQSTVDITGWLFDDNNGVFNGSTVAGAGISSGHLRFANNSFWQNVEIGTYVVLFNGHDTSTFDQTNPAFVNAFGDANGVYAVNNGADSIFIFVAVGISPYIEYKGNLPIVGVNNKSNYCSQDAYSLDSNAWNAVALRNGDSAFGDGFQVRCPGCIDNPNFSDDPAFYHGVSYSAQNSHVSTTVGQEGPHVDVDTLGGTARAFEFFQGTATNSIGVDSNWRYIDYSLATPGFENNGGDNLDFRTNVAFAINTYPICSVFVPDTTPVRGVLIVTEFSNGPSGSCEYVELLVAACGGDAITTEVDIRGWILDDNNGVFGAGTGKGITTGHLKFANVEALKTVPVGTVIVLFNGDDNCYGFTADEDYSDSTLVLQIDGTSPTALVVNNKSASGISVKPTTSDSTYCQAAYEATALDWNGRVGFGNTADGVQVRCPDCEPVFYHGAAYGTALVARAQTPNDLGGPKLATGSQGGKTFILSSGGCDVGNTSSWTVATAATAGSVPATAGVVDALVYAPIITNRTCALPCCVAPSNKMGSFDFENTIEEVGFMVGNAYPNPANNELNIDINTNEDFTLTFIDITGRVIYNQAYKATNGLSTVTINLSDFATGAYFFNVVTNTNNHTDRVVISR